jgi:hypothetical protein
MMKNCQLLSISLAVSLALAGCSGASSGDKFCEAMEGSWVSHETWQRPMFDESGQYDIYWTVRKDGGVYVLVSTGRSDGKSQNSNRISAPCVNGVISQGEMYTPATYTESDDRIRLRSYVLQRAE